MIRRLIITFVFIAAIVAAVVFIPTNANSSPQISEGNKVSVPDYLNVMSFPLTTVATVETVPTTTTTEPPVAPVTTTTTPVQPAPVQQSAPVVVAAIQDVTAIFECIIRHESGGDPAAVNPSSGAGGLFQFLPSSWLAYGGGRFAPLPNLATADQQWQIALAAEAQSYWYPWVGTNCTPVG